MAHRLWDSFGGKKKTDIKHKNESERLSQTLNFGRTTNRTDDYLGSQWQQQGARPKGPSQSAELNDPNEKDFCVLCMHDITNPETLQCGHVFCKECIEQQFQHKKACPTCGAVCGTITEIEYKMDENRKKKPHTVKTVVGATRHEPGAGKKIKSLNEDNKVSELTCENKKIWIKYREVFAHICAKENLPQLAKMHGIQPSKLKVKETETWQGFFVNGGIHQCDTLKEYVNLYGCDYIALTFNNNEKIHEVLYEIEKKHNVTLNVEDTPGPSEKESATGGSAEAIPLAEAVGEKEIDRTEWYFPCGHCLMVINDDANNCWLNFMVEITIGETLTQSSEAKIHETGEGKKKMSVHIIQWEGGEKKEKHALYQEFENMLKLSRAYDCFDICIPITPVGMWPTRKYFIQLLHAVDKYIKNVDMLPVRVQLCTTDVTLYTECCVSAKRFMPGSVETKIKQTNETGKSHYAKLERQPIPVNMVKGQLDESKIFNDYQQKYYKQKGEPCLPRGNGGDKTSLTINIIGKQEEIERAKAALQHYSATGNLETMSPADKRGSSTSSQTDTVGQIIQRDEENDSVSGVLPVEILRLDDKSIELYKEALADGKVAVNNIRVMVVGHVGVGKTALTRRLLEKSVDPSIRESTNGIQVYVRRCQVSLEDRKWTMLNKDTKSENTFKLLAKLMSQQTMSSDSKGKSNPSSEYQKMDHNGDVDSKPIDDRSLLGDVTESDVITSTSDDVTKEVHVDITTPTYEPDLVADNDNYSQGEVPAIKDTNMEDIEDIKDLMKYANNLTNDDLNYADVSIWDFAGQSAFYGTHQVFLSPRVVYLLVTDISKHIQDVVEEDDCYFDSKGSNYRKITEYVEFWLNSIHGYCASQKKGVPPVILVGTHADKLDQENNIQLSEHYFEALRNVVIDQVTHDHLADENFAINNTIIDPKLTDLRDKIVKVASEQQHWGELIPARWITLEKALTGLEDKGLKICTKESLQKLNQALPVPLTSDEELSLFLRFQHDAGNIIYFSDSELCDHILLDPQWLVDAFKCLITAKIFSKNKPIYPKWREFNKTAILTNELIDEVWAPTEQPGFHDHRDQLIALMERLDMIARPRSFVADGVHIKVEDYFLVPCMLKKIPDYIFLKPPTLDDATSTSTICFTMTTGFIPVAVFNRLLSSCLTRWPVSKQGQQYLIFCGVGVFDVDRKHRLTLFFSQNVIQLWVKKFSKKNPHPNQEVCTPVRKFIEETFVKIKKPLRETCEFKLSLKCPDVDMRSNSGMFDLEDFLTEDGEVSCHCHGNSHVLISSDMLKYWGFKEPVSKEELSELSTDDESRIKLPAPNQFKKDHDNCLSQPELKSIEKSMESVGMLVGPRGSLGTAFRVGEKYVMTNWHVILGVIDPLATGDVDYSRLEDVWINFNTSTTNRPPRLPYLTCTVVYKNDNLDVVVLEIHEDFILDIPVPLFLCRFDIVEITNVTEVTFVGFGHPTQEGKRCDPKCKVCFEPNIVNEAKSYVRTRRNEYNNKLDRNNQIHDDDDLGYKDATDIDRFICSCFLEKGGSGAPALTTKDPKTVQVVGILASGTPDFLFCPEMNIELQEFPKKIRFETVIKMSSIYSLMIEENEPLAKQLFQSAETDNHTVNTRVQPF